MNWTGHNRDGIMNRASENIRAVNNDYCASVRLWWCRKMNISNHFARTNGNKSQTRRPISHAVQRQQKDEKNGAFGKAAVKTERIAFTVNSERIDC